MAHDRSTVESVVQLYFDGLYEGSADKLGEAFHPSADLRWHEKGDIPAEFTELAERGTEHNQ